MILGIAFSPSTMKSRRFSNSATICSTHACGPASAATPAICVAAFVHETEFTASRPMCGISSVGKTPYPSRQPGHRVRLREAVQDDRPIQQPRPGRHAVMLAAVQDPRVDLVGQDVAVVVAQHVRDRLDVHLVQEPARRVGRRVQDHQLRFGDSLAARPSART